jgi:hypothetical protein
MVTVQPERFGQRDPMPVVGHRRHDRIRMLCEQRRDRRFARLEFWFLVAHLLLLPLPQDVAQNRFIAAAARSL